MVAQPDALDNHDQLKCQKTIFEISNQCSEITIPKPNELKEHNSKVTKKDLSKRFDVVIKTLVRAIKRYYSAEIGINFTKKLDINSPNLIEGFQKIDKVNLMINFIKYACILLH